MNHSEKEDERTLLASPREPDLMLRHLLEGLAGGLEAGDHRLAGGLHLQQPRVVAGRTEAVVRPGHWEALNVLRHGLLSLINFLQLISDRAESVNGGEGQTEFPGWFVLLSVGVLVDTVSQSVHPHLSLSGTAGSHLK